MTVYIIDNSNHGIVGGWVSDCIPHRNGRKGYIRESGLLKAFGVDIDDVLDSLRGDDDSYYPRIVKYLLEFYK